MELRDTESQPVSTKRLCGSVEESHIFCLPRHKPVRRRPIMCLFKEVSNKRHYVREESNLCFFPIGNLALPMSCLAPPAVSHADASH